MPSFLCVNTQRVAILLAVDTSRDVIVQRLGLNTNNVALLLANPKVQTLAKALAGA